MIKKLIIPLILIFLFCTVKLPAQNAQVSPIADLSGSNASVVNNNMNILQSNVNTVIGSLNTIQGYFSNGILSITHGGTGTTTGIPTVYWVPHNIQVFTSTGNWSDPAGVTSVYVKVWGAGGGAGDNVTPGGDGGTSSFAGTTTIQATGGTHGATTNGAAGGVGSNGIVNLTGQTGMVIVNTAGVNSSTAPMGVGASINTAAGKSWGYAYGGVPFAAAANRASGGAGGYSEGTTAVTGNVIVTVGTAGASGGSGPIAAGGGLVIVYY